jgi:leader peptidase (prepilin peptidase)/N-methyltransferase
MTAAAILLLYGLVGAVAASYVTTASLRATDPALPTGERSCCEGCRRHLPFLEMVPVVSYAALRGRCRVCAYRIDPAHPVGEVVGFLGGLVIGLAAPGVAGAIVAIIGLALLASSVIDARTRTLPDLSTLVVAAGGAGLAAATGAERLLIGLGASLIATGVLLAVRAVARTRRGEPGLGLGDVKLVAALALWVGLATPWMLLGAALLGLMTIKVRGTRDGKIAFGPMIAAAGFIVGVGMEAGLWPALL